MPNTYLSDKAQLDAIKSTALYQPKWLEKGDVSVIATYAIAKDASVTLGTGDVIKMMTVPAGVKIHGVCLDVTDLDNNGSPSITLSVGDGTTAAKYIDGSTVGQAGGIAYASVAGCIGSTYTTATQLLVTVKAGATGTVVTTSGASITLRVTYTADP